MFQLAQKTQITQIKRKRLQKKGKFAWKRTKSRAAKKDKETPQETESRLEADKASTAAKREKEAAEERVFRLNADKAAKAANKAEETPEERNIRLEKDKKNKSSKEG